MSEAGEQAAIDEHVFLVGRPPLGEYLSLVRNQAVEGRDVDQGLLADEWRRANDRIAELEATEAGLADEPPIGPLGPGLEQLREEVLRDPVLERSHRIVPWELGVVELDRLVVFQKHINLRYVAELRASLPEQPSEQEIFRFCLPFERNDPPVQQRQIAQNAYVFISPSADFRFLDHSPFTAAELSGYTGGGFPTHVVGLVIGYGSNYLNAIRAEGRLILNNGSHRAYALREAGITHVPCLVQRVTRRDELEMISSHEISDEPDRFLTAARPPLLKDYFDPQLRKIVRIPRKLRQVRVTFAEETIDLPAV